MTSTDVDKAWDSEDAPLSEHGRSGKGRPKRNEGSEGSIHDALLAAAEECLMSENTSKVPVRRIAAKAGVNQAMINYYFNSKDGLLEALFETNFFPLIKKLREFETRCKDPDQDGVSIEDLVIIIDEHFAKSPALFVLQKDMMDTEAYLNKAYNGKIGSRGYSTIVRIIRALMERGICRDDIAPEYAAYFICSICGMHHVLTPILDTAFNGLVNETKSAELGKMAAQLLGTGQQV